MKNLDFLKGRLLKDVLGLVYVENNINAEDLEENNILKVLLNFEGRKILIECDEVGIGLKINVDNPVLEEVDMGEYGFLKVINISNKKEFNEIVGIRLGNIKNIIFEENNVGFELEFFNKRSKVFINLGDELYLFDSLPKALCDEGYIVE
ncbi:hypothetical protein ACOUV0_09110 [Acinetobacter baumannii]|uniref:hypothetical protein n=1 Tax=Acinetobacter baumannii TaxID=470 RepID=UPI0008DD2E86|nr:hypothetical protein [Acinetobacter baumannii]MDC4685551.1 hypothetical protein [Acinetobacter baumannii]MDH1310532.1 hypothetical protein [Acinetobacter baumannii]MDN8242024.1 hypothetical protein [Acinetobacter baumannii]MDV7387055.1 hypothetical protein [Acinetobacter baumannii]OIF78080.1 hypothetical protein A7M51_01875 [Acinetobacter baumannii]